MIFKNVNKLFKQSFIIVLFNIITLFLCITKDFKPKLKSFYSGKSYIIIYKIQYINDGLNIIY